MAANGYQKHILIGNLGADPKVFQTQNGNLVTNFDIAVNERNADGTEIVTWYGIAAWNGLGEVCAEYLAKGRQVMVEGTRLEATAWMGRDGNLYTKMELVANEVKFLAGNGDNNGTGNGGNHDNGRGHANNTESMSNRRTANGRTTNGRTANGRTANGRTANGRTANGRAANGRNNTRQTRQPAPSRAHEYDNALGYIPDNPEDIAF